MKSIVPAAVLVLLEAGFLFSLAVRPARPDPLRATVEVAARQAPAAPAPPAPAVRRASRS